MPIFDLKSKIKNQKSKMFCVLCLVFCSFVASAQEVKVTAEKVRIETDAVENGDSPVVQVRDGDVIIVEGDEVIGASTGAEDEVIAIDDLNAEESDLDADRQDRGDGQRQIQRFQQDDQLGQRPGERLTPEARRAMREIMEKEDISPEELRRDPEVRRRLRERAELISGERENDLQPSAEVSQRRRRGPARGEPADERLKLYIDAVVKNNLFLPLGAGGEEEKTSFALTAVVSGSDSKAIIEEIGREKSYYVSEGDTFADEVEVVEIDEQMVRLDARGENMELRLGEGTESKSRRGRRGGERPGTKEEQRPGGEREGPGDNSDRGGQGDFDPDRIPPPIRRMLEERNISIDELQRNPELREELRREFEERFRNGGPQVFRLEMRSPERPQRSSR